MGQCRASLIKVMQVVRDHQDEKERRNTAKLEDLLRAHSASSRPFSGVQGPKVEEILEKINAGSSDHRYTACVAQKEAVSP